jgi:hypothetical protein
MCTKPANTSGICGGSHVSAAAAACIYGATCGMHCIAELLQGYCDAAEQQSKAAEVYDSSNDLALCNDLSDVDVQVQSTQEVHFMYTHFTHACLHDHTYSYTAAACLLCVLVCSCSNELMSCVSQLMRGAPLAVLL